MHRKVRRRRCAFFDAPICPAPQACVAFRVTTSPFAHGRFRVTADRQWSELRNANAEVASVVKRLHDLYGAHPGVYADGVRTAVASFAKRVRFFQFFSHALTSPEC